MCRKGSLLALRTTFSFYRRDGGHVRGSVSTLAVSIIALVAISQILAAVVYSVSTSSSYLTDFANTMIRLSSIQVSASRLPNGSVKISATAPIRVLASYLISDGNIVSAYSGGAVESELVIPVPPTGGDTLLVVMEGGKFAVIPLSRSGNPSSDLEVLDYLGYKIAVGLLINYVDYLNYGPIHVRAALNQPPGYADTGYRPILQGNAVFYYTGITHGLPQGNYWWLDREYLVAQPNLAVFSTGVSQNPVALTQVLRVTRGSGNVEILARVRVEVLNTTNTGYYPRILVVCYVLPGGSSLQLPAAVFQPPALNHEPWYLRKVLYLAPPGQGMVEYEEVLKLAGVPEGSYVLVGAEVITYGIGTTIRASISVNT